MYLKQQELLPRFVFITLSGHTFSLSLSLKLFVFLIQLELELARRYGKRYFDCTTIDNKRKEKLSDLKSDALSINPHGQAASPML